MKLTNVTADVLDNIKDKYATRIKLWYELQKLAISTLEKSHEQFIREFKYHILSPFTFKAPDYDKFCSGVLGYGRITKVYSDDSLIKTVLNDVVGDIKFVYALHAKSPKYELPYKQNRIIEIADKFSDIIYFNTLDDIEFYKMVINNFESGSICFENSDIKRLTRWDDEIIEMTRFIEKFKE